MDAPIEAEVLVAKCRVDAAMSSCVFAVTTEGFLVLNTMQTSDGSRLAFGAAKDASVRRALNSRMRADHQTVTVFGTEHWNKHQSGMIGVSSE